MQILRPESINKTVFHRMSTLRQEIAIKILSDLKVGTNSGEICGINRGFDGLSVNESDKLFDNFVRNHQTTFTPLIHEFSMAGWNLTLKAYGTTSTFKIDWKCIPIVYDD